VRVTQVQCALHGGPIYLKGAGAWLFFCYGFYRNEAVLRPQALKPARGHTHEAVVPLLVHVDVGHVTDEGAPRVEDAPLAQFALGGRGCWENSSLVRFMRSSLVLSGKGALLTALNYYSAVRSHQTVGAAGSPLPKSGRRDPSPKAPSV
jgi:hypothetical protein